MSYEWPPRIDEMGDIVKNYIDSGMPLSIANESGVISQLEQDFAKLHGMKYALAVSSGTMALYSAFFAMVMNLEKAIENREEYVKSQEMDYSYNTLYWGE